MTDGELAEAITAVLTTDDAGMSIEAQIEGWSVTKSMREALT